jgi:aminoglycoside 6'-N-acetyltransferase I
MEPADEVTATIRRVEPRDAEGWRRMRARLWPEIEEEENLSETSVLSVDPRWSVIVAEQGDELVGFVEAHLRDYAEGCDSTPVGFLEGWYVEPEARRSGVGRALVAAAEAWAREQGCSEMAADAEIENDEGHRAHEAIGFEETERLVCFRKVLT